MEASQIVITALFSVTKAFFVAPIPPAYYKTASPPQYKRIMKYK